MAKRLFIYVPFPKTNDSDIKKGATELLDVLNRAGIQITTTSGHTLLTASLLFVGEEAGAADIDAEDVLFLHAHGGDFSTSLFDNTKKGEIKLAVLLENLSTFKNAGAFYFAACFSALDGHIAQKWKGTKVYGYYEVLEGALVTATRAGTIRNSMLTDGRLTLIN